MNSNLLKAKSKRFNLVSTSTCVVETWAFLAAIEELNSLITTLEELKKTYTQAVFFCDNKAAIDVLTNHKVTKVSKLLAINDLKVKQSLMNNKKFVVKYIKSEENISDLFTKNLGKSLFTKFRDKLVTKFV